MLETKNKILELPTVTDDELLAFDGPECRLSAATLYHGSGYGDIDQLSLGQDEDSMPATLGEGLYFTVDKDSASAYARHRTSQGRGDRPTVYQVRTGNDVLLANLDNSTERDMLYTAFQEHLLTLRPDTNLAHIIVGGSIERLSALRERLGTSALTLGINGGTSYLFSEFMKSQGYDGVIATEGGERGKDSQVEAHRSVVIFDPANVSVEAIQPS